jgi:AraC-like DNA-binding protein
MTNTKTTPRQVSPPARQLLTAQLQRQLQHYILQQLPQAPRLSAAARSLHMSSRTLQRILQQSDCSFRQLVNQCRHQLAQEYLQDGSLTLQQIAFQLGFEEQSSFQKAFKGWQGCSPGAFRLLGLSQPSRSQIISAHYARLQVNYGIN